MNAAEREYISQKRAAYATLALCQIAEPWSQNFIHPAIAGDVEAAFSLCVALRNAKRGDVAVILWQAQIPRRAFQAYFGSVWEHDHREVLAAAGTRRRLASMFRYASFDTPEIPQTVRVWRGTSGGLTGGRAPGISWSLNRDVACWFAMRFAGRVGRPVLLEAEVQRADIAYYTNERREQEVVILRSPDAVVHVGDQGVIDLGYEAYAATLAAGRESVSPARTAPGNGVSTSRLHDATFDAELYDAIFGRAELPPEKDNAPAERQLSGGELVKQAHSIVAQSSAIAISENPDIQTFPDPRSAAFEDEGVPSTIVLMGGEVTL
ncbi:hypothetical protein [Aromatoleum anaerobium]|uniref:Uncharacterized protein n=1 Tax=Aromatoleum anaerobium TaxID=182180 RepID=A0ABX1PPG9_9RHOO|nr:hypothetical protein [Aromatoleum anaerobium]MCK0506329.1 hypothetical protein [Aromatoleum anaerobium]